MTKKKDVGFGKCSDSGCGEYAIVGLNGKFVCEKHLSIELGKSAEVINKMGII